MQGDNFENCQLITTEWFEYETKQDIWRIYDQNKGKTYKTALVHDTRMMMMTMMTDSVGAF